MVKKRKYIIKVTTINPFAYGVMAKSKAEATELAARGLAVPLFPDRAKYLYEARLNKVERIGK